MPPMQLDGGDLTNDVGPGSIVNDAAEAIGADIRMATV